MKEQLAELSRRLSALAGDVEERPTVAYQTGPDESVLIGTERSILKFISALLDAVATSKPEIFQGVQLRSSEAIAGTLNPLGAVSLDSVLITESESDAKMLVESTYH